MVRGYLCKSICNSLLTYLIFSSGKPRVSKTKPHSNSLNAIPLFVPPHAIYNQSANTVGTPSDNTSCKNAVLLSVVTFEPVERLKASLMRRNSLFVTENPTKRGKKINKININ